MGIIEHIEGLIALFQSNCAERETLDELALIVADQRRWKEGHKLFQKIRAKTLAAERFKSDRLSQYLFEESCAKTIYNLSGEPAPFDADSPSWILPNALALARCLGVDERDVIQIVS